MRAIMGKKAKLVLRAAIRNRGLVYLWSLDQNNLQNILVDYYKNWGEKENQTPGYGWKDSFEFLFEITLDDFYVVSIESPTEDSWVLGYISHLQGCYWGF